MSNVERMEAMERLEDRCERLQRELERFFTPEEIVAIKYGTTRHACVESDRELGWRCPECGKFERIIPMEKP
jgi:hypothetical protein